MGRGRAKAKQTRVARDLKYRTFDTDFASLERELKGSAQDEVDYEDVPDQYADLVDDYLDDGDGDEEDRPA